MKGQELNDKSNENECGESQGGSPVAPPSRMATETQGSEYRRDEDAGDIYKEADRMDITGLRCWRVV